MMARLSDHIETIDLYVQHGCEPGSCTRAILENDLFGAVSRADAQSQLLLAEIVKYIYNHAPIRCWGSREKVDAWIRAKRLEQVNIDKVLDDIRRAEDAHDGL